MLRNALPKRLNVSASSIVDLPEPFSPTIKVAGFLFKSTSVKTWPVDKKFFQRTLLKFIII